MKEFDNFKAHFRLDITKSISNFATNVALKYSRYIFTWRTGKQQMGYCTHCAKEFNTDNLKHKTKHSCPSCKSKCEVRASHYGRSGMADRAVFVWYEKSKINPKAITARVISLYRNYNRDFRTVKTEYSCCYMYLFEPGKSTYYQMDWNGWNKRTRVTSAFDQYFASYGFHGNNATKQLSISNLKKAVKGTEFQYSTWEKYIKYMNKNYVSDMTEFFNLAARYPCVEYLTKLGFEFVIWAKLYRNSTHGAIYWRGKTPQQILRLPTHLINEMKTSELKINCLFIRILQLVHKDTLKIDFDYIRKIENGYGNYMNELQSIVKHTSLKRAIAYLEKQYARPETMEYKLSKNEVLTTWRDYIRDCISLEMDLKQDALLFPTDLITAHQDTIAKVTYKSDPVLNEKIKDRLKKLNEFMFQEGNFILRPAHDSVELIREGNALRHCIGGYAKDYAHGKTDIFLIREVNEPDRSFYTMQVTDSKIHQCRGYKNRAPTHEIKAFMDLFFSKKLSAKKSTRVDVTKIKQVEVAV